MPYTPVSTERFGGLDLYDDPTEIGLDAAVLALNIDLDQRGRFRTRDGTTAVSSVAAANAMAGGMSYYKDASGVEWMIACELGSPGVIRSYNIASGAAGATQGETMVAGTATNNSFARFGDPSNTRLYAAPAGTLRRFDGAAWAATAAPPIGPTLLAVTANDNRLAIATGASSRIHFSDAGAPETFGANNYVDLWPGDGEVIKALIRWRDYLFVFKQSKFAVFTGTSTAGDGTPVFNYRAVDAGRGVYGQGMVVAGDAGVYFADAFGIYVTAGGPPEYISKSIEPWMRASTFTNLPTFILRIASSFSFVNRRLYVTYANGTSSGVLVYDTQTDSWFAWQGGFLVATGVPAASQYQGLYFGDSASKKVAWVDPAATTDLGSAISWSYTTGYTDVGGYFRGARIKSAERKNVRETDILGSGTLTHQLLTLNSRPNDVADTGGSVTLGTAPALARGKRRRAARGTHVAHKLSGSGVVSVSKLTHWLSGVEQDT